MRLQLDPHDSQETNAKWQLLVVDDEKECARLFAELLKRDGYSVRTACSGSEALATLRERPADLVLTDMVMPGMNGLELLVNIKEFYPETDVIILTGYGTIEDSLEAIRRGAADFLPKPFQPRELVRLTASCLRAKQINSDEALLKQSVIMSELARILSETPDMRVLPSRAAELARDSFHATSAVLFSLESASQTFRILAQAGTRTDSNPTPDVFAQGIKAIQTGNTFLAAGSDNGECRVYAPLTIAGRPCGLLYLNRSEGPWFAEKSVEMLKIFATHLALALESIRLYESNAQHVRDLQTLMVQNRSTQSPEHIGRPVAGTEAVAGQNSEDYQRLTARCREGIALLGRAVDSMHRFSAGHSKKVSLFSGLLARALNLTEEEIAAIEDAAFLHDIGKVCIPDFVLDKPGPLSAEEFAIIKTHPVYGAKLFEDAPHLWDVVPVVRHHHENYDGSGYPDGLRGKQIPLAARITALGDVFDALISQRPYRPAIAPFQAKRMIELKAGSQFDPYLAEIFLSLPLEKYIPDIG